jgi:tetratricopeptide (TPR) repeat protein
VCLLALSVAGAGCTSQATRQARQAVSDFYAGDFAGAERNLRPLAERTDEDFVLNNARLGSVALTDYSLNEAEAAFLKAYEVMNSVGVNNGGRTLGAVLVSEDIKVWKGEPFDRAMVNYYLGLIYYIRHDYENARAAFENALFKLRDYGASKDEKETDKYRAVESGFTLAYLMLAKSWQHLGREDMALANFNRVAQLRPDLAALADPKRNAESNFLLVLDYGYGPRKVTDFDGSIVGFGPKPQEAGPIPMPLVYVDGRVWPTNDVARPTVDTLALAQDRVWQSIDTIRTVKSAIGTGLIAAGAFEGIRGAYEHGSSQRRDLIAGAALAGAGLLLKATSQADTRTWELLPRATFVVPLRLEPGMHDVRVQFAGGISQTWRDVVVPSGPGEELTFYKRMLPWHEGPFKWPPPTAPYVSAAAAVAPQTPPSSARP